MEKRLKYFIFWHFSLILHYYLMTSQYKAVAYAVQIADCKNIFYIHIMRLMLYEACKSTEQQLRKLMLYLVEHNKINVRPVLKTRMEGLVIIYKHISSCIFNKNSN